MFWPDPDTFWQFSGDAYADAATAAACLDAQDRFGADVNVILLCLWMDTQGVRMQGSDWANLLRTSDSWQREILGPHRQKRRALKGRTGYDLAKQEELNLERQEQKALLESLEKPPKAHPAADSMVHYFDSLGADFNLSLPTG